MAVYTQLGAASWLPSSHPLAYLQPLLSSCCKHPDRTGNSAPMVAFTCPLGWPEL